MTLPSVIIAVAIAAATSVHFPATTSDPAASTALDRGLFLYYAYDGPAAARSFEEAVARDPGLAAGYWGIALADGPDLNTPETAPQFEAAKRAIGSAAHLESRASPSERAFIDAMALRYAGTFADWAQSDAAYRKAMLTFAQSSHDRNAALLAAEALLEHGGLDWNGSELASPESRTALELVEGALRDDPSNPMANHLCLHLYDLAPDRTPALPCAQRLDAARFTPEAEHLAHMPAHYWIETGDYAAALASSDRAYVLLMRLGDSAGGADHVRQYSKHDVAVGYSAAMMLGNYAIAQQWAQRMAVAYDLSFNALTALRFGRYDEAYSAQQPQYGDPAVRGLAALHLGHTSEARSIAAGMIRSGVPRGYLPQLLLARLAEADGNLVEARRWIARAASNQRDAFSAELIPPIPAGEALGFLELRTGDAAAASAAFSQTLAAYPDDPRALYGLGEPARPRFQNMWKGADTTLAGADFP